MQGMANMEPNLGAIKAEILADLEAKFMQKESSLWKRGQVEIERLQQAQRAEVAEVRSCIEKIQERQNSLATDMNKIKGALLKFELVVLEMRQVLRSLPLVQQAQQQHPQPHLQPYGTVLNLEADNVQFSPSPSVASTSASEVLRAGAGYEEPTRSAPTPGSSICTDNAISGSVDRSLDRSLAISTGSSGRRQEDSTLSEGAASFLTPQRPGGLQAQSQHSAHSEDSAPAVRSYSQDAQDRTAGSSCSAAAVSKPLPATPLTQSPAVLSIASALASGGNVGAVTPQRSTPVGKRLQLAECLDQPGTTSAASVTENDETAVAPPSAAAPTTPPHKRVPSTESGAGGAFAASPPVPPLQQQPPASHLSASPCASSPESLQGWPAPPASLLGFSASAGDCEFVNIELVKEEGFVTLGMEVKQVDNLLHIEGIDEHGLVYYHNICQDTASKQICVGDIILEVNGVSDDPENMLQECKVNQRIAMILLRCGACATGASVASSSGGAVLAGAAAPAQPANGKKDGSDAFDVEKAPTPPASRGLRPEAEVFVPAAQTEASAAFVLPGPSSVPPGFARLDSAPLAAPTYEAATIAKLGLQHIAPSGSGAAAGGAQPSAGITQTTHCTAGDEAGDESTLVVKRKLFAQ